MTDKDMGDPARTHGILARTGLQISEDYIAKQLYHLALTREPAEQVTFTSTSPRPCRNYVTRAYRRLQYNSSRYPPAILTLDHMRMPDLHAFIQTAHIVTTGSLATYSLSRFYSSAIKEGRLSRYDIVNQLMGKTTDVVPRLEYAVRLRLLAVRLERRIAMLRRHVLRMLHN